jgi:hypothetical protein
MLDQEIDSIVEKSKHLRLKTNEMLFLLEKEFKEKNVLDKLHKVHYTRYALDGFNKRELDKQCDT